ncbi:MAG TPA: dephospho-CoA kinase [Candidatus Omnitrophota bacterium]|nr:dephospho-CoA kinase [Candidatus Omnitrophota bacterium]HQO38088.1 dephospho-CoA kinase [Candidatus Omnitrophota bacterium]HQQ06062.1 dephospho-CoA kinase [Candidatus Omnitrophota bacterium]
MKKPAKRSERLVIGLTGGLGTGKTTVAGMLQGFGARVIDADAVGHELLAPGTRVHAALVRRFGTRIVCRRSGAIDREALGRIVFSDDAQLKSLNNIMHPAILKIVKHRIAAVKKGVVVVDAPLLVETGFHRHVDRLVVVTASRNHQIKRVQSSRRLSKAAAFRRIHSQIPLQDKVRMADFVIDNNGTRKDLRKAVTELRRMWWTS